jgi:Meiotically up-regulated gene 113
MPVYFIRAGEDGPVKIGWAANVEKRRKTLQTAHHRPLHLIRVVDGDIETERWFHRRFSEGWLKGEWFEFHSDMVAVEPPTPKPPPPPPMFRSDPELVSPMSDWRRQAVENPDPHIRECVARIDAMHALHAAGWEPRRIARSLGMTASLAFAERWMRDEAAE